MMTRDGEGRKCREYGKCKEVENRVHLGIGYEGGKWAQAKDGGPSPVLPIWSD